MAERTAVGAPDPDDLERTWTVIGNLFDPGEVAVLPLLAEAEREIGDGPLAGERPAAWSMRHARAQHLVLKAHIAILRGLSRG